MRQKDQAALAPLRMLKAALMNREVEKGRALDEAESLQVVNRWSSSGATRSISSRAGGRQDLADKEQAEVDFLQRYLPPAADEARSPRRSRPRWPKPGPRARRTWAR